VHGVASGLKEWKGSQSRDDEKLPVDCAGLGAGFPDKEPMPTAPYTCIGIDLGQLKILLLKKKMGTLPRVINAQARRSLMK